MRSKNRLYVLLVLMIVARFALGEEGNSTRVINDKEPRQIFSPRMDYDQWKPLGRGDPLKNDPTYDYVPPVLDRVHYWIDPAVRKPDPSLPSEIKKTEILLLGVSSKKPSTGTSPIAENRKETYDNFLKFVDGPKFNSHQRVARPHYLPSYFSSQFYSKKKPTEQRIPYTMLMPPPVETRKISTKARPNKLSVTTISPPHTTVGSTEVTVQASNLVYQSSSLSTDWASTNNQINWTPNPTYTTKIKPFKDEIVFQKHIQPPESFIHIQFSPTSPLNLTNKNLLASNSDQTINYVTPPPLIETGEEIMHKGQVSDDDLDVSNTYVKIGKTEAQMHSTGPEMMVPMMVFSHVKHPMMNEIIQQTPMTMQTIQSMQTMQPPPITTSPVYQKDTTNPILWALNQEKTETTTVEYSTTEPPTTTLTSLTTDPLFKHYKQPMEPLKGPLYLIIQGHSKVKTYGPTKQIHGISVQETNEISNEDEFKVKHLHYKEEMEKSREGRSKGDLQTLKHVVQTGLGKIEEVDNRKDFSETELETGYKVGEVGITSEKYHKGIVEEARKLELTTLFN